MPDKEENIFGNPIAKEETIIDKPTTPEDKTEGGDEKKDVPEDVKNSEHYKSLEEKNEEYSKNLTGQRDAISRKDSEIAKLNAQIAVGNIKKETEDKEVVYDVPNKDIKFVKDLPEEEREDLTDTEKSMMDKVANMEKRENDNFINSEKSKNSDKASAEENKGVSFSVDDVVKAKALELSGGDKEMANNIIQKYNMFDNKGITEADALIRISESVKLVENFKPQEHSKSSTGKTVKPNKTGSSETVDKIMNEENSDGTYDL